MYRTPTHARTYDQTQIEAKLIVCKSCKRAFYMTHRRLKCIACRQACRSAKK